MAQRGEGLGGRQEPRLIWLPDGRLAWQTPDSQNYRIRDLWTGRDEYLFTDASVGEWVSDPTFSPRGDQLVFVGPIRTGPMAPVVARSRGALARADLRPIGWSADGEWIYAIEPDQARRPWSECRRERAGPKQSANFPSALLINSCDLTPDRDVIVCSLIEQKKDAWVMENFDPGIS